MKRPNQLLTSLDTRMNFIRPHYRYLNIVHWLGELNWNPLAVFIERKIHFPVPDGGYVNSPVPGQSFERCIYLEPCESSTWSLSDFFLCVENYFPFSGTFMEHFFGYSATGFFFFGWKRGNFWNKKSTAPRCYWLLVATKTWESVGMNEPLFRPVLQSLLYFFNDFLKMFFLIE